MMKRWFCFFLSLIACCILFELSFADSYVYDSDLVLKIVNANRRDVLLKQFPNYSIYLYEVGEDDKLYLYQIYYNDGNGQMTVDFTSPDVYLWELYDDEMNGIEYYPEDNRIIATVNATGGKLWGGYFDLLEVGGIVRNFIDIQPYDDYFVVYGLFTDEEANAYYGDIVAGCDVYAGFLVNKETLLIERLDIFRVDEKDNAEIIESDLFEYGGTDEELKKYNETIQAYRQKVASDVSTREVTVILVDDNGNSKRISQKVLKDVLFHVEVPTDFSLYSDEQFVTVYNADGVGLTNNITLYAATEIAVSKAMSDREVPIYPEYGKGNIIHGSISGKHIKTDGQAKETDSDKAKTTASSFNGSSTNNKNTASTIPVTLKISGSAKCIAKNHVGSKWIKEFYLNGEEIKGTGKITVECGDSINIRYVIIDDDKNPDVGVFNKKLEITPEIMTRGTKIEETIYVTENSGRYSGYSAEWSVVITIRP